MEKREQLQTQSIPKLIGALSAPAILSMLVNSVNMAIDKMFVARGVGVLALSGVTISLGVYLVLQGFSLLLAAGSASAISLRLGKGDQSGAEKLVGNSLILSVGLSVLLTIIGLIAARPMLVLYGANAENIRPATEYSSVLIWGALFFLLAQTANSIIKGMGYAKRAFINVFLSIVVNTALDAVFIFIFHWGVFGAALSTVIGNGVSAVLAVQFLCTKKSPARIKLCNLRLHAAASKTVCSIGTPACVTQIALSLLSLTCNHVADRVGGSTAVAAYGIVYSVIMLVYMPVLGLGQGIQPIIGYNYSAQNYRRTRQTLQCSITFATVFCIVMFGLIELFARPIVTLFGGETDPSLIAMAVFGLRLFSLSLPIVGFQMIGANYFQYIEKYRQSVFLAVLRQLVLPIAFILILSNYIGMTGIWLGAPVSDFIAFILTIVFIKTEMAHVYQTDLAVG